MTETLIWIGSIIIILWGIAHIIPARGIIKRSGDISADNKKILAMGVIGEGLALVFLGVLPLLIVLLGWPYSVNGFIVYRAAAGMLLAMAVLTLLTGARTPPLRYKICPLVKVVTAIFFIIASVL